MSSQKSKQRQKQPMTKVRKTDKYPKYRQSGVFARRFLERFSKTFWENFSKSSGGGV